LPSDGGSASAIFLRVCSGWETRFWSKRRISHGPFRWQCILLPAGLAIFYGLATLAARLVWSDDLGRIAALAVAFGASEWLRATVLTGFPWNSVGYVAMPIPLLMQSVILAGPFGMNALAVFVFSTPALLANRRHLRGGVALAILLVLAHAGYGSWRLTQVGADDAQTLSVRIVQPSIDQSEKWDGAARDRIFSKFLELSALPPAEGAAPPQLIVWPETSFPFLLTDRPDALVALSELLQEGQMLAAGAVRVEGTVSDGGIRYYNSILMINDQGEIVDGYDKVHLVPFGEYIPFEHLLARVGLRQLVQAFPGLHGRYPAAHAGRRRGHPAAALHLLRDHLPLRERSGLGSQRYHQRDQ
jgi:apolipoprotein N-acyltransferase